MKKVWILAFLGILILAGCSKKQEDNTNTKKQGCDDSPVCDVAKSADMSAYEGFDVENNQFIEITMDDAIQKMETDASGIFYFGFPTCPWCIEAVPIMNEVAQEMDLHIYYINKKADTSNEENIAKMTSLLKDIVSENEEGVPTLYVPEVVVINEGEITDHHADTVPNHDAHERKMNEEEQAQLKEIYQELFAKLKA